MRGIPVVIALVWATTSGAVIWGPWSGAREGPSPAPKSVVAAAPQVHPVVVDVRPPSAPDEGPATWMLVLVGAAVLCFVAARQAD